MIIDEKKIDFDIGWEEFDLSDFTRFSFLFFSFVNEREKLIISQGVDDGFDAKM